MGPKESRRLNILTQAEIDAFSAIPTLSDAEKDHYFHLNDEESSVFTGRESFAIKAVFILFFGYFKFRPMVVSPTADDARDDFLHICNTHFPGEDLELVLPSPMQKSRMYDKIFNACGTRRFTPAFRERLLKKAVEHVRIDIDRRAIFDALMTFVYFHETEIPKYYVFQAIVSEAIRTEEMRVSEILNKAITPRIEQSIDDLLNDEHTQSALSHVKKLSRTFSRSDFRPELLAFDKIYPAYADLRHVVELLNVSKGNISHYASLVEHFSVSRLKQVSLERRRIYLVCYLYHRFQLINDNFYQAFIFTVRKIATDAKAYASKRILSERHAIEAKLGDAADVVDLFVEDVGPEDPPLSVVQQRAYKRISRQELAEVSQFMRTLSIDQKRFEWEYIDKQKRQVKGFLRQLFMALEFIDSTDSPSFMNLVNSLHDDIVGHGDLQSIDRRSLTKAVRPYLLDDHGRPIAHRVEFYIYQGIQRRLDKCQWYVENSSRYDPFEQDLIDPQNWESEKDQYIEAVNLQALTIPPAILLQEKLADLEVKLARVAEGVAQQDNESIILTTREGAPKWTVKRQPKEVEVNNPFFKKMRRIEVIDVIAMVARDTEFFQEIRHIKGRSTRPDDLGVFMACLIANATRFGTYKMSEICDYSYDVLRNFHGNYMRQETLHSAIDRIHNATAKLKIFKYYNIRENIVHASSDGQKFTARKNTLRTRYSTKHFGQGKGLSAYTMNAHH